ncbi:hypothetical protein [Arthrobacter sp. D5-1]|uniref:hypothetical protein n=1 Tax=Arthrobacter sp. D5-1 TaxID=1477518 RepID=UPI001A989A60|nr:hypothetical protein [Arthrobacter sp. D5-1]QSZ49908.1 hypothetical protein AYX22_16825 [Arthrobacter sp. D5-1]
MVMIAGVSYVPPADTPQHSAESASPPSYPISGYFITANTVPSKNREKLADIADVGGDTAITFGTLLRPATAESIPEDCVVEGTGCARFAEGSVKVNRYFTYADGSNWGDSLMPCPRDKSFSSSDKSYAILFLPAEGMGCTSPDGTYDVVIVGGSKTSVEDPTITLAAAATELNMKFYAGLPAPVKRSDVDYLPDLSYSQTLERFTERFLQYQASRNDVTGLAGFYHHIEMPVSSSPFFDPILSLYAMQNRAIHRVLPTRTAIVSPYIESRTGASNVRPEDARLGTRKIAQTSSGLKLSIAIQDGMGTGKGAAYLASEADSPVDVFAASIVGKGMWGEKYVAPNRDYFHAAAAGVSGTDAVLWANLEGMAPATKSNPCGNSLRGQTTVARMDRQLQQMAEATKVISFMWDPYFTCTDTGKDLKSQITDGFKSPIVTGAVADSAAGVVMVTGFNLSGGNATLKWDEADGSSHERKSKPLSTEIDFGEKRGLNPRLESITIDLGDSRLPQGKSFSVDVTNQWNLSLNREFADGVFTP